MTFQKAARASDPMTAEEFGDGALMRDGFSLLWLGWQWDTPAGRMRMTMPIATEDGNSITGPTTGPITGLVRGNFIVAAGTRPGCSPIAVMRPIRSSAPGTMSTP